VPRIHHPDWLARRVANLTDKFKQHKLADLFAAQRQTTAQRLEAGLPAEEEKEYVRFGKPPKQKPAKIVKVAKDKLNEPLPTGPAPDFEEDYPGWVQHMKPFWRRKQAEMAAATASGQTHGRKGLVSSMLRTRASEFSTNTTWEIVQLSEVANRAGEFRLWLLIRDTLQSVRLTIPRQFYLNLKQMPTDYAWPASCYIEEMARTLPRGQKALNLVRLTVEEYSFRQDEVAYGDLLNRPEVDGVYEMQLPLLVRGLITLGKECVAASTAGLSKGLDKGFELEELKRPSLVVSRRRYLDGGRGCLFAYLYHATAESRHFIALVAPSGKTRIWIVERGNNREAPSLERYYREQLASVRAKATAAFDLESGKGAFDYPESMTVETTFHANDEVAFRSVTRDLNTLHKQKSGPVVLVAYSPASRDFLEYRLQGAMANFPMLCIAARSTDSAFPALGWRLPAAKRFVQHYLRLSAHLKNTLEMADSFDLPLCNFPTDESGWCADIDFARRIAKTDGVLWWSPNSKPDLAGKELDSATVGAEESLPELSRPGVYANASLELELRDLCVDAILQSALVYELEGATATGVGIGDASHNLDEYAKGEDGKLKEELVLGDMVLPAATFALLKAMVKSWWQESGKPGFQGKAARKVLDHLCEPAQRGTSADLTIDAGRWLASPSANMYDPALYKFVAGLMRKT
jgi:DNA polymerase epsilon subunit 1